ncbi:hypothetical protein [Rodentibacter caecimuris]|uniref:hypothetical protein n=1 Tax=Rodentibacter caecimuris TaxID=1796644 RepID=UPI0015C2DDA6
MEDQRDYYLSLKDSEIFDNSVEFNEHYFSDYCKGKEGIGWYVKQQGDFLLLR